jgi:hypothetical protein
LLEDALDVHWVAANSDLAPARADQHERLIELGERAMEQRFGRPTVPLTAEEQEEFKALRQAYRDFRASWTLASEPDGIALIRSRWGEEAARNIEYVYDVIQRQNNALLHSSPIAYALAMSPLRRHPNRVGPDPRWREALAHGVLGYYLIFRVIAEEFGFDKDVLADRYHDASCLVKAFTIDELAGLDRNAACPCRSGRTLGDCHAS